MLKKDLLVKKIDLEEAKKNLAEQDKKVEETLSSPGLEDLLNSLEDNLENPFSLIELAEYLEVVPQTDGFQKGFADSLETVGYFTGLMNGGLPADLVKELVLLKINSKYEIDSNKLILDAQLAIAKEKSLSLLEQTM